MLSLLTSREYPFYCCFYLFIFVEVYLMYNIIQVRGVQFGTPFYTSFGESQFLKITLHLYLLLTIGYIPYVL